MSLKSNEKPTDFIKNCLNDTETEYLSCRSFNNITTRCSCVKSGNHLLFGSHFDNKSVFSSLNNNETFQVNHTYNWYFLHAQIIQNCFHLNDTLIFKCKTLSTKLNETTCTCFSDDEQIQPDVIGNFSTNLLYQGLKDFILPPNHDVKNMSSKHHAINQPKNDFSESNSELNPEFNPASLYMFIFMSFVTLFFMMIWLIFKNRLFFRKCYNNDDDTIPLTLVAELDE